MRDIFGKVDEVIESLISDLGELVSIEPHLHLINTKQKLFSMILPIDIT